VVEDVPGEMEEAAADPARERQTAGLVAEGE
jgi:hypothetical protein